jgi:hypothetical protein
VDETEDQRARRRWESANREPLPDEADEAFAAELERAGLPYEIQRTRVEETSG